MRDESISLDDRLKRLMAKAKPTPMKDYLSICVDRLRDDTFIECDHRTITVSDSYGDRRIMEFDEGLTERHYSLFAPVLKCDYDKGVLALAVIENILYPTPCQDWCDFRRELPHLFQTDWIDVPDWLVEEIRLEGFDAVVKGIKERWAAYKLTLPIIRPMPPPVCQPTWDNGTLSVGDQRWMFRRLPGRPLFTILDEFQNRDWPHSLTFENLYPEQVRDVAKWLRAKTGDCIVWVASNDSTMRWRWAKRSP